MQVCRDPRWGRCYESFSEDTKLVQLMTAAVIPGLQGAARHPTGIPVVAGPKNVAGCAKHFVGDGGTRHGINENNTVLSFHDLMRIHMPPYYDAVIKGVSSVMISYSSWNGVKMHENKFLITQILKDKMRFRVWILLGCTHPIHDTSRLSFRRAPDTVISIYERTCRGS